MRVTDERLRELAQDPHPATVGERADIAAELIDARAYIAARREYYRRVSEKTNRAQCEAWDCYHSRWGDDNG